MRNMYYAAEFMDVFKQVISQKRDGHFLSETVKGWVSALEGHVNIKHPSEALIPGIDVIVDLVTRSEPVGISATGVEIMNEPVLIGEQKDYAEIWPLKIYFKNAACKHKQREGLGSIIDEWKYFLGFYNYSRKDMFLLSHVGFPQEGNPGVVYAMRDACDYTLLLRYKRNRIVNENGNSLREITDKPMVLIPGIGDYELYTGFESGYGNVRLMRTDSLIGLLNTKQAVFPHVSQTKSF